MANQIQIIPNSSGNYELWVNGSRVSTGTQTSIQQMAQNYGWTGTVSPSAPPVAQNISYGVTNPQPVSPYVPPKPNIPASTYNDLMQQVVSGKITGNAAIQQIQDLVNSGKYSDTSVNIQSLFPSSQTFPNGTTYTDPITGKTVNYGSTGQPIASTGNNTTTGTTTGSLGYTPTGNDNLDKALASISGIISSQKAAGNVLAPGLQVTPELVSQFLAYAHQVVDPQTQQAITTELSNVNADLENQAKQYGYSTAGIIRDFGTSLATEQNAAGASGTAFSGQRALNEQLMADTANNQLGSAGSTAAYNIGNAARSAAAQVGASNAGGINTPSLVSPYVSQFGGQRGTAGTGNGLGFNYTPSLYTVGTIPSAGNTNVANQQANYLNQYMTLAGAQSGAQPQDLVKQLTGLPAGV